MTRRICSKNSIFVPHLLKRKFASLIQRVFSYNIFRLGRKIYAQEVKKFRPRLTFMQLERFRRRFFFFMDSLSKKNLEKWVLHFFVSLRMSNEALLNRVVETLCSSRYSSRHNWTNFGRRIVQTWISVLTKSLCKRKDDFVRSFSLAIYETHFILYFSHDVSPLDCFLLVEEKPHHKSPTGASLQKLPITIFTMRCLEVKVWLFTVV